MLRARAPANSALVFSKRMQLIDQFGEKKQLLQDFFNTVDPTKQYSSNRKTFMRMEKYNKRSRT